MGLEVERSREDARDWLTFRVSDSGIGMTPEQCDKVFEAFAQADTSTTRKYGGTGLGLAITRQFCQILGGSIDVASEIGKGTTFTVRLPAEVPAPTRVEEAEPAATAPARGKTVLVVDDDLSTRDLVSRFLSREGYGVLTAASGEEALRLALEHRPDVITLDVVMPGIDGWTVLSQLQADPGLAAIPVILLTITDDRNLGYALGASEFPTKPVDWVRLGQVLERFAGGDAEPAALVVDDDPGARLMMRRGLERAGWQVSEAENGHCALERLAESTSTPSRWSCSVCWRRSRPRSRSAVPPPEPSLACDLLARRQAHLEVRALAR